MKRVQIIILLLLLMIVSSLGATEQNNNNTRGIGGTIKIPGGKTLELYSGSYALVIGNGNYKNGWDSLPGVIKDVKEVAAALRTYGFNVTIRTDLTREDFSLVLSDFSIKYGLNSNNQLLIYYAGHGYTQKMANDEYLGYLIMADTPLPERNPVGFSTKAIDMQVIVTQAKKIKARHVLFMFDSCFSGTLLTMRDRVIPKNISDSVKYPVRQFITAGRADESVPDHSVFKQAFLDLLGGSVREPVPDGYITGEELGFYLKNKVPEYNPTQHPQYGKINDPKLNKGDFVFTFDITERWHNKQEVMITDLNRLKIEAERLEIQAKELEAKRKIEEIKRKIAEAKRNEEIKRLEAETRKSEAEAKELEARFKVEELKKRIAKATSDMKPKAIADNGYLRILNTEARNNPSNSNLSPLQMLQNQLFKSYDGTSSLYAVVTYQVLQDTGSLYVSYEQNKKPWFKINITFYDANTNMIGGKGQFIHENPTGMIKGEVGTVSFGLPKNAQTYSVWLAKQK